MENSKKPQKTLRSGVTTGSCAAAAARGAVFLLLNCAVPKEITIVTPTGIILPFEIKKSGIHDSWAYCAVQKDSGDDPDITNGIFIYAWVRKREKGISIDGGEGIGRITKKGLEQPVGAAAINRVPRQMVSENALEVCGKLGYTGGLEIIVTAPEGKALAKKTFNPRLGIVGGISILGTTGIVEPMSEKALFDSIEVEIKMKLANGENYLLITPGNYGETFLKKTLRINIDNAVKVSNFIGDSILAAREHGCKGVLLVGHLGKLVKLAGGIMQTHSKYADCRMELLGVHAAMVGAESSVVIQLMECVTTEQALSVLNDADLLTKTLTSVLRAIVNHIEILTEQEIEIGVILFSESYGLLAQTENAKNILNTFS